MKKRYKVIGDIIYTSKGTYKNGDFAMLDSDEAKRWDSKIELAPEKKTKSVKSKKTKSRKTK